MRSFRTFRIAAAVAACSVATSALSPVATAQTATDVTLLGINDFHGHLENAVALAGTVQDLRGQFPGAELLAAGDNVGGSPFVSAYKKDQPTIEVLNTMGMAAAALGNHEFDKGIDDLQDRIIPAANWSYLGANVSVNGTPMKAYEVLEINGVQVGIVGAVTKETPTLVSPGVIAGVEFADPVESVNRVADQLSDGDDSNGEADVIVASFHEGSAVASDLDSAVASTPAFADIVNDSNEHIDAIFTGHTNQAYAWEGPKPGGGTRPVMQSNEYGKMVGRITLSVKDAQVVATESELYETDGDVDMADPVVAAVKDLVDANAAEADVVGNQPVGTVNADITTAFVDGRRDDRLSESALSNLVADFMVDAVESRGGADVAFMNPGGVRSELLNDPAGTDGNITKAEANSVLPFANTLMTMEMSGAQLKTVLEQQWQPASASRPFLALGASDGFTWTFDPTRASGDRITSIALNGEPIDPAATYSVVTQSFLASGGDNFTEFSNAANIDDTGLIDSEAWQEFLEAHRADGIDPDFGRHAVAVNNVPATIAAGDLYRFTVSDLNLTSVGAPQASSISLEFDGNPNGNFPVIDGPDTTTFGPNAFPTPLDGRADITTIIPSDTSEGLHLITLTTDTGTVITIPVMVGGEPLDNANSVLSSEGLGFGSLGNLGSTGSLG